MEPSSPSSYSSEHFDGSPSPSYIATSSSNMTVIIILALVSSITVFIVIIYCVWPTMKHIRQEQNRKMLQSVLLVKEKFRGTFNATLSGNTFAYIKSAWNVHSRDIDVVIAAIQQREGCPASISYDDVVELAQHISMLQRLNSCCPHILNYCGLLLLSATDYLCLMQGEHVQTSNLLDIVEKGSSTPGGNFGDVGKLVSIENISPRLLQKLQSFSTEPQHLEQLLPCIVLEWCEFGTLREFLLAKRETLSIMQALRIASELVSALKFLYGLSPPIVHPDLRSGNVFVASNFKIKLGGFSSWLVHQHPKSRPKGGLTVQSNIRSLAGIFAELFGISNSETQRATTLKGSRELFQLIKRMRSQNEESIPNILEVAQTLNKVHLKLQSSSHETVQAVPESLFKLVWSNNTNSARRSEAPWHRSTSNTTGQKEYREQLLVRALSSEQLSMSSEDNQQQGPTGNTKQEARLNQGHDQHRLFQGTKQFFGDAQQEREGAQQSKNDANKPEPVLSRPSELDATNEGVVEDICERDEYIIDSLAEQTESNIPPIDREGTSSTGISSHHLVAPNSGVIPAHESNLQHYTDSLEKRGKQVHSQQMHFPAVNTTYIGKHRHENSLGAGRTDRPDQQSIIQVDSTQGQIPSQDNSHQSSTHGNNLPQVWTRLNSLPEHHREGIGRRRTSRYKKLVAPEDLQVLLVDDDDFALASMQHALEMCHYAVTGCNNGRRAMDILQSQPARYDVVLTDALMPAMNGLSLLGAIQKSLPLRHIPIILVSSSTSQIMQALKLGAKDYLVKPLRVFEAMTLFPKVKIWQAQEEDLIGLRDQLILSERSRGQQSVADAKESLVSNDHLHKEEALPGNRQDRVCSDDVLSDLALASIKDLVHWVNTIATKGGALKTNEKRGMVKQILWKDIELVRLAGVGSGGSVYKAKIPMKALLGLNGERYGNANPDAGEMCCVACKRFNRDSLMKNDDFRKSFYREIKILSHLNHPNIMQLLGISGQGPFIWHVSEYVRFGSLAEVLQTPRAERLLPVEKRLRILTNIADALDYMHRQPRTIIHRDLKPSNVLITRDLRGKLSDFAYSRSISGTSKMTRCGTPAYVAPEVMLGHAYDESIDTYAFGITMWQVLTREMPYASDLDPMSILKKTSRGERPIFCGYKTLTKEPMQQDISEKEYETYVELTLSCWAQDRNKRPTMQKVCQLLSDMISHKQ